MFIYGKMAANAIAVMSYLAGDPQRQAGSPVIAQARGLSPALTAKLLTRLAAAGLVAGRPGPGGGYRLARPPREIRLIDIVRIFEQSTLPALCPFGDNWCGVKDPCPLHHQIMDIAASNRRFLETTNLSAFEKAPKTAPDRSPKPRR